MKDREEGIALWEVTLERLGYGRLKDFYAVDITEEQHRYVGMHKSRLIRKALLSRGRGKIYLICRNGETCGYLSLWVDPEIGQFTSAPFIIEQRCQRSGTGRAALRLACGQLFGAGGQTVRLAVHPENEPAIRLYKQEGFRFTGQEWGENDKVMGLEKETFLKQGGRQE